MEYEKSRIFFALRPDDDALERLLKLAREMQKRGGGRVPPPQNIHLTLNFVGAATTAEIDLLSAAAAQIRIPPFRLRLDRCAVFPRQKLLWAGCRKTPRRLALLATAVDGVVRQAKGLQAAMPDRRFLPHVTLLRNISQPGQDIEQKMLIEWACRDFMLFRSALTPDGPVYSELGRWPLLEENADSGRDVVDAD